MSFSQTCKTVDELSIGERFEKEFRVEEKDVELFGKISGDFNPIHFDEDYARKSMFGKRIAHGLISLSKFSGIFGTNMPGAGTLWSSQTVQFLKPVYIGVQYKAIAEVVDLDRRRATIATWVEDAAGEKVLLGEAVVIPPTARAKEKLLRNASLVDGSL